MKYCFFLFCLFYQITPTVTLAQKLSEDSWSNIYWKKIEQRDKAINKNFDSQGNPYPCAINGVETSLEQCSYSNAELLLRENKKYTYDSLNQKCKEHLDLLNSYIEQNNCPVGYADFIIKRRDLWLDILYSERGSK